MTPEEQAKAALLNLAPDALDGWSVVLELLNGLVALTVKAGWDEPTARHLVAAQFIANLNAIGQQRKT